MRRARVFVTGATCPLGVHVCRILQRYEARLIALARDLLHAPNDLHEVEWLQGKCEDSAAYEKALKECSFIVHIAGMHLASWIIRACAGHPGLSRILFISSTRAHYPDRMLSSRERIITSVLLEEEKMVTTSLLPWTVLRPTLIFSPGDRSISRVIDYLSKTSLVPIPGNGEAVKQPIAAIDVARSTVKALLAPAALRKAYDIPGRDITVKEIVRVISGELGVEPKFLRVPKPLAVCAKRSVGLLGNRYAEAAAAYLRWYENIRFSEEAAVRDFHHASGEFVDHIREQLRHRRRERSPA